MMNREDPSANKLIFLIIAIILMVGVHFFVFGGEKPYVTKAREEIKASRIETQDPVGVTGEAEEVLQIAEASGDVTAEIAAAQKPEEPGEEQEEEPVIDTSFLVPDIENVPVQSLTFPEDRQLWQENAVHVFARPDWPKVVVIIDDLGTSPYRANQVMLLPGPLTLSFLPYAEQVKRLARRGREYGHELMLHMPMEPVNEDLDTGPLVLRSDQSPSEFEDMLYKALSSFDGYVGINNHMGSKLTQDEEIMKLLMKRLKELGLVFVDSWTIETSVATRVAADMELPHASRDVFLDHDTSPEAVRESLQRLENIARERGYAIGIGHPRENTIAALKEWLPTLEEKKLALVPVSMVVMVTPPFSSLDSSQPPSPQLQ